MVFKLWRERRSNKQLATSQASLIDGLPASSKWSKLRRVFLIKALLICAFCSNSAASLFEDIRLHKLSNGIRVVLDAIQSRITAIAICVRAGSRNELEGARGAAHMVEHLLFLRMGFGIRSEKIGKIFPAEANAETSFDYTAFYCVISCENTLEALKLMFNAISSGEFDRKSVELEREIIGFELVHYGEEPIKLAKMLSQWLLFRSHPYGYPLGIFGKGFPQLAPEQIRSFYEANYLPENISIIVSGRFEEQSLLNELEATFGTLKSPTTRIASNYVAPILAPKAVEPLVFELDKPFNAISMSFCAPGAIEPELFIATEVLTTYIGDPNFGVLAKNFEKKGELAPIDFNVSFVPGRTKSLLSISLLIRDAKFGEVEGAVLKLLNSIRENAISEAELFRCKNMTELRFRQRCNNVLGRAKVLAEAEGIASHEFAQKYPRILKSLGSGQLLIAAKRIFNRDSYAVAVVRPKGVNE